jgi:hypothetical protein
MIGRRAAGRVVREIRHRRAGKTIYKEAGLQGEGSGRLAGVGVVVTHGTGHVTSAACAFRGDGHVGIAAPASGRGRGVCVSVPGGVGFSRDSRFCVKSRRRPRKGSRGLALI